MSLSAKLSSLILKIAGWKVDITVPDYPRCIICVAPHTSNWDFILGKLAYASIGRKAGFLMKDTWFVFPLGIFFRAIGGVPVPRSKQRKGSLVDYMVNRFKHSTRLTVAITPEGTRSKTTQWHTGFLRIAYDADVPIVLGAFDFPTKRVIINETFQPTGDLSADIAAVKTFYRPFTGLYPDKFSTD